MTSIRARKPVATVLALGLCTGCAQVISRSTVEIMPRSDATPLVIGPPGGEVSARGVEAEWTQDGDRVALRLTESRTCTSVRHVPVVRIERVDRRTAGGAMWFEYGLGAGALATGLAGLIRPQAFSQGSAVVEGQVVQDTSAGYRIGGIFTALGAILLTAAVVDTVRTRDEVIYTDAYRRNPGGTVECRDPLVPLRKWPVELVVDEWTTTEPTDGDGTVRFLLPRVDELPDDAREVIEAIERWEATQAEIAAAAAAAREAKAVAEAASSRRRRRGGRPVQAPTEPTEPTEPEASSDPALGPRPEPVVLKGVLRIDDARVLVMDFVVPYDADAARGRTRTAAVQPVPSVNPPSGAQPGRSGANARSVTGPERSEPSESSESSPPETDASAPARDASATDPVTNNNNPEGTDAPDPPDPSSTPPSGA